jgi:oligopeptide/dipeptide ABC transporter ATP-binding protein
MSAALLEVIDLFKHFPVKTPQGKGMLHAVDGVSFRMEAGETVGLVGESGCGKSTLVRLLTRTLGLTDGQIRFLGTDLGLIDPMLMPSHKTRRDVQMVFQDAHDSLNPRYSAFDTIAEPLRLLMAINDEAEIRRKVEEIATLTGLPHELLPRFPHQLSGGQKARVGIARAAVQLLADLKRELGMSFLFVSHDLNVVRLLCDRVLVMYLGRIVESGPAAELFAAPKHPYTQALIASIPGSGRDVSQYLLLGDPQSPIRMLRSKGASSGEPTQITRCGFQGRCPHASERCASVTPALQAVGTGREAACHHLDSLKPF